MGGCVGGVRYEKFVGYEAGKSPIRASDSPSPLSLRVVFHTDHHPDAEAKVIRSLAELLWIDPAEDARLTTATCIAALNAAKAAQSEMLLDFAVPVVNAMLHAPHEGVRHTLWECFVLSAVRDDIAVAHLFYWALKCVITSPQAKRATKREAEAKLQEVTRTMASQAQVATALSRIKAANEALQRGQALPSVPADGANRATPLVELLDRLHVIGEDIVKVKDKQERQKDLKRRIDKMINERMVDSVPVPVLMLTPNAADTPDPHTGAALLRLPAAEARVLSSKERAPYLVVIELERLVAAKKQRGTKLGSLGSTRRRTCCPCRAARGPPPAVPKLRQEGLPPGAVSSRSLPCSPASTDASPVVGGWSGASSPRMDASSEDSEEHEEIARYLRDQDQRPRGAFNKESWDQVVQRVRSTSEYGKRPDWSMLSLIVKSNADDVRQEELAYRLLKWFQRVFRRHKLKLWLHPFLIVATRHDGGCLETVTNAISLSDLKKSYGARWHSLRSYYEQAYQRMDPEGGAEKTPRAAGLVSLEKAVMNFIWSMASYSIVCYVLAIRDRHNGNILIDDEGHILHVDFGFMLCGAPGGKAMQKMGGFEHSDGFKLTKEFVEVLGPTDHRPFQVFRQAVLDGLQAVRAHADELLALLQLSMLGSENHQMMCFQHPRGLPEHVLEDVCERLGLPGMSGSTSAAQTDEEFRATMEKKIYDSVDHWRSRLYDKYQKHFTGVL